jgi:hypothetical protein
MVEAPSWETDKTLITAAYAMRLFRTEGKGGKALAGG